MRHHRYLSLNKNEDATREIAEKVAALYCRNAPMTLQDVCDSTHEVAISAQDTSRLISALTDLAVRALVLAARNDN